MRARYPGFERAYILDAAPQVGVRQTRLLEGEYVVTREDVLERRTFPDVVARGRDYYTPYRSLVPKHVDGLLVAGRCYSRDAGGPAPEPGDPAGDGDGRGGRDRGRAEPGVRRGAAPRGRGGVQKRLVAQGVNLGTPAPVA